MAQAWLQARRNTARPARRLIGFQRLELAPGETGTATFRITPDSLRYPVGETLADYTTDWEPGEFELMIGRKRRGHAIPPLPLGPGMRSAA